MLVVLALAVAGCAGSSPGITYVDSVAMPTSSGGPFGGDGTIHAIAIVMSFEVDGPTYGDIGAHCGYDGWTATPTTARIHIGDGAAPTQAVMRMLMPGQDTQGVSHFGTATHAATDPQHLIKAAFDHTRTLGTVTWDPPAFDGAPIPSDAWLVSSHQYHAPDGTSVVENLYLRDFGQVPVSFDREEKMCF